MFKFLVWLGLFLLVMSYGILNSIAVTVISILVHGVFKEVSKDGRTKNS